MEINRSALTAGLLLSIAPLQVLASEFNAATIRRMVEGRQVFIDRVQARVNQTAGRGQQVSTGSSRAELLFDRRALGFLGKNSLITLGQQCFRLQSGTVLVNGKQTSCLGSRVLGVRGTTYVLTALPNGEFNLAVLHGEARLSGPEDAALAEAASAGQESDILSRYPRLNPVIDLGSSAFGSNAGGLKLGQALGLVLGDAGAFLPLMQSEGSQVLYSYTRGSANFDGFWGVSSEVGYRWFDPNNRSLNGALVGYDGWQGYGCFQSQVAVGAEWERNRWQFTALGGIPIDSCQDSVGYAIAGVGIPIANAGTQSVRLGLAPYVLHGIGNNYGGGRVSLSVPIGHQVDLMAYGQYDRLLDTTVGGQVRVRFSTNGSFVRDPNLSPLRPQSPLPWQSQLADSDRRIALQPTKATATDAEGWLIAANPSDVVINAGEEARLDSNGSLISKQNLNREKFELLINENLGGMHLLPESHAIGKFYEKRFRQPTPDVLAVTGLNWYLGARTPMPRLRGANNLVVPADKLPQQAQTAAQPQAGTSVRYVCGATIGSQLFYYDGSSSGTQSISSATQFSAESQGRASCSGLLVGGFSTGPATTQTSPIFI